MQLVMALGSYPIGNGLCSSNLYEPLFPSPSMAPRKYEPWIEVSICPNFDISLLWVYWKLTPLYMAVETDRQALLKISSLVFGQ